MPPLIAGYLRRAHAAVKPQLATAIPLSDFFAKASKRDRGLTPAERRKIVDQALVLLELNYAHLPLKRAIHAIEPVQRLKLLKFRLSEITTGESSSDIEFHEEMQEIFTSLRDFHTNYSLPAPFDEKVAFLPFLIEEYFDDRKTERRVLVTHVQPGFRHPTFKPGVDVLYWNGVPIERAIAINGETQAGSNPDARFAAGLSALTIRPMIGSLPPDEHWVVIGYRSLNGRDLEYKQPWLMFTPRREGQTGPDFGLKPGRKSGIDLQRAAINQVRKILFAPKAVAGEKKAGGRKKRIALHAGDIATSLPSVLRAHPVPTPQGSFGYIRIFTFEADKADEFVAEFIRLIELLPQDGLMIDVRGNGGGYIENGERLLQLFTPRQIEPETFEFINTALNLDICRAGAETEGLADWAESIRQSVLTGSTHSRGFALTSKELCNAIGQRYYGPALLIIDALCYSTTDMFAAGFQDHDIGDVVGVSGNTGAGGANVWDQADLLGLMRRQPGSPYKRLPKNAGMRVALLRSLRVGARAGTPLEELGVVPDERHYMTRTDVLDGNADLINRAAERLAKKPVRGLSVAIERNADRTFTVIANTRNVARVDLYVGDRPRESVDVARNAARFSNVPLPKGSVVRLEGFDRRHTLVAMLRRSM